MAKKPSSVNPFQNSRQVADSDLQDFIAANMVVLMGLLTGMVKTSPNLIIGLHDLIAKGYVKQQGSQPDASTGYRPSIPVSPATVNEMRLVGLRILDSQRRLNEMSAVHAE
jgi:hypothetical protein